MMPFIQTGVLIPVAIGGAVLAIVMGAAWFISDRTWLTRLVSALCGLALAGTFIASFLLNDGSFPPRSLWHWMLPIVAVCSIIGVIAAFLPRNGVMTIVVSLALATAAMILLRPPPVEDHPWLWRAILGGGLAGLYLVLQPLAHREATVRGRSGVLLPAGFAIAFAAASVVLMQSYNSKMGFMAGAMAAVCGVAAVLSLISHRLSFSVAAVAALASSLATLLVIGRLWDEAGLPAMSFALAGAAPAAMWISQLPLLRRRPWISATTALAGVALVAGIAIGLTFTIESPPPYEYEV